MKIFKSVFILLSLLFLGVDAYAAHSIAFRESNSGSNNFDFVPGYNTFELTDVPSKYAVKWRLNSSSGSYDHTSQGTLLSYDATFQPFVSSSMTYVVADIYNEDFWGNPTTWTGHTYTWNLSVAKGNLTVTINPTAARSAGARWRVTSGSDTGWKSSGTTLSLAPGSYSIEYNSISGWTKPSNNSVTISSYASFSKTGTYVSNPGSFTGTIYPSAVRSSARWRLSGNGYDSGWQQSGATESVPAGSFYTLEFNGVSGWEKPSNKTVSINSNTSHSGSGTYEQMTGNLTVTISPSPARNDGARWRVTSGSDTGWKTSGTTLSLIPGSYTVEYSSLSGWSKPSNDSATISANASFSESGTYERLPGEFTGTINPIDVRATARWRLSGNGYDSGWQQSGTTETVPAGSFYTLEFSDVSGWVTPSNQSITVNSSSSHGGNGTYVQQTGSIGVSLSPSLANLAGAQWKISKSGYDSGWQNSGANVTTTVGNYTLSFKSVTGWNSPSSRTVTISNNFTLSESGTYTSQSGAHTVTISPSDAITAGAQWKLYRSGYDSGWQNSGATIEIPANTYTLTYKSVPGWNPPSDENIVVSALQSSGSDGVYTESPGSVSILIEPLEVRDAGAQWRLATGPDTEWHSSGTTISVPPGIYGVEFRSLSEWRAPIAGSVTVTNQTPVAETRRYVRYPVLLVHGLHPLEFGRADGHGYFAEMISSLETAGYHYGGDIKPTGATTPPSYTEGGGYAGSLYTLSFSSGNNLNLESQGQELNQAINRIIELNPFDGCEKVILVGHSMGGLASRKYIQDLMYVNDIDVHGLITMGTPHYGSLLANIANGVYQDLKTEGVDFLNKVTVLNQIRNILTITLGDLNGSEEKLEDVLYQYVLALEQLPNVAGLDLLQIGSEELNLLNDQTSQRYLTNDVNYFFISVGGGIDTFEFTQEENFFLNLFDRSFEGFGLWSPSELVEELGNSFILLVNSFTGSTISDGIVPYWSQAMLNPLMIDSPSQAAQADGVSMASVLHTEQPADPDIIAVVAQQLALWEKSDCSSTWLKPNDSILTDTYGISFLNLEVGESSDSKAVSFTAPLSNENQIILNFESSDPAILLANSTATVQPGQTFSLPVNIDTTVERQDGKGYVLVSTNNWQGSVLVQYQFKALEPVLTLSQSEINSTVVEGGNTNSDFFEIRNSGAGTLTYSITDNVNWLSVTPASGSIVTDSEFDIIEIVYDTNNLELNESPYSAVLTVSAQDAVGSPKVINVTLTVEDSPPINTEPVLSAIGDRSVDKLAELTFIASATDNEESTQTLTYSLTNEPAGALIDPSTGVFTWKPTEAQGPDSFTFTVSVSDGDLSDSEEITVTVNEANVAPVLDLIGDKTATALTELSFTATATDSDVPAQTLTFSLVNEPSGASIDQATGAFTWTPTEAQAGSSYIFTIEVSDGALMDSEEITITVSGDTDQLIINPEFANTHEFWTLTDAPLNPSGSLTVDAGTLSCVAINGSNYSSGLKQSIALDQSYDDLIFSFDWKVNKRETPHGITTVQLTLFNAEDEQIGLLVALNSGQSYRTTLAEHYASIPEGQYGGVYMQAEEFDWESLQLSTSAYIPDVNIRDVVRAEVRFNAYNDAGSGGDLYVRNPTLVGEVGEVGKVVVFEEDWETGSIDPEKWINFGSPLASVTGTHVNGSYAMTTNGDASWGSGVATKESFPLVAGFGAEVSLYMDNVTNIRSWADIRVEIGDISVFDTTYSSSGPIVFSIIGTDVSWGDPNGKVSVPGLTLTDDASSYRGKWTRLGFLINDDGSVTYSIDGTEVHTTASGVIDLLNPINGRIVLHGRSEGATMTTHDDLLVSQQLIPTNTAPQLSAVGNKTVNELEPLTFVASASDSDAPAQVLTYSLTNAPDGASINPSSGEFSWTPTEAQGLGTYAVTIQVSDGIDVDSEAISITVNEVNIAPVLGAIGNRSIDEINELSFSAEATDADVPAQSLTFSLIGAPAGALIDETSGAFSWIPTEAQGPGSYTFTVQVDDGVLTDSEEITVTVNELNGAPSMETIGHQVAQVSGELTFTVNAEDSDYPAQDKTFSLVDAPEGASIEPSTGVFSWTPTPEQAGKKFTLTIEVSDGTSTTSEEIHILVESATNTEGVLFSENFDDNALDSAVSVTTTGSFSASPGIKSNTALGSLSFGFGKSTVGANDFNNYNTHFDIDLGAEFHITRIEFREREEGDWGSYGGIFLDGSSISSLATPTNTHSSRGPLDHNIPVDQTGTVVSFEILDITNASEVFIDDIVIYGYAGSGAIRQIAELPLNFRNSTLSSSNGLLYVFGGTLNGSSTGSTKIHEINLETYALTELLANLPYGMGWGLSSATGSNGKIYLGPARGPTSNNGWGTKSRIVEFDPSSSSASEMAVGYSRATWGTTAASDNAGLVYFFGGHNGSDINTIYRLDPSTGVLEAAGVLPWPAESIYAVADRNGRVYIVNVEPQHLKVALYDPSDGSTDILADLPAGYVPASDSNLAWVDAAGDCFFVLRNTTTNELETFKYDVSETTVALTEIETPPHLLGGVATQVGNTVYLLGGDADGLQVSYLYRIGEGEQSTFAAPILSWLSGYLPSDAPYSYWKNEADLDFDDMPHFMEYALGRNPMGRDSMPPVIVTRGQAAGDMRFGMNFRADDPAVNVVVKLSNNLSSWETINVNYNSDTQEWSTDSALLEVKSATEQEEGIWNLQFVDKTGQASSFVQIVVTYGE